MCLVNNDADNIPRAVELHAWDPVIFLQDIFHPYCQNILPRTFPLPDDFPPFLHGVGHVLFHHHHPPIYKYKALTCTTVNVYTIDSGRSVRVSIARVVPSFKEIPRLVSRLGSGVRVSASSEIFALIAGENVLGGREIVWAGDCPGEICPRGEMSYVQLRLPYCRRTAPAACRHRWSAETGSLVPKRRRSWEPWPPRRSRTAGLKREGLTSDCSRRRCEENTNRCRLHCPSTSAPRCSSPRSPRKRLQCHANIDTQRNQIRVYKHRERGRI